MQNLWVELKIKMKEILLKISEISKYHEISIINFSSSAIIECKYKDPNTFDVNNLTFQNGGTSFEKAFSQAHGLLTNIFPKFDLQSWKGMAMKNKFKKQILIFMSDGKGKFPQKEIHLLKEIKFDFYSISFKNDNKIMSQICKELGGKMHFAENPEVYKKICIEILENPEILAKK